MKNTLFLISFLFTISFTYSACCEDDEQPNDGEIDNPYDGCCASSPETYTLDGVGLFIPNSFTPDANGVNDGFLIYSSPYPVDFRFQELTLTKSDGQILYQVTNFEPNDFDASWNGRDLDGNAHIGYFQYKLTITDTEENIQTFTGSACVLNCDDSPLPFDNIDQCIFGLNHDGQGGYDPNFDNGETTCF